MSDWIKDCVDEMEETFALEGWSRFSAEAIMRRGYVHELESDLEHVSRENEAMSKRLIQWRTVAHLLAQRLRSLPESGAARFPDARDRAALEEYDNLVRETKTS